MKYRKHTAQNGPEDALLALLSKSLYYRERNPLTELDVKFQG